MRFQFYFILLLLVSISTAQARDYKPYVTVQSIAYSSPIAIKAIGDGWKQPFYGGDNALTFNKLETGVYWQDWQLGYLERCDYLLEFSPQTVEFIYLTKNKRPLEIGKEYELYIKALHNCSNGLKLGRKKQLTSTLSANLAISYLHNKALTDGSISGTASVTAEEDYDFQFDADYLYARDPLFDRHLGKEPTGNGYSLDVGLDWQPTEKLSAQLDIIDLTSRMYWDDAPYTTATATSETKTYDEDGYLHYDPAITGFESYKRFEQTWPRKIYLAGQYQWTDKLEILAEHQNFDIQHFTSIGAGLWYWQAHHLQGLYNITAEAVTLRYMWKQLHIELGGDKTEINKVRYFVFQLSYNHAF